MKTYRITITYELTEEAYIEAMNEEEARQQVLTGQVDCDWSTLSTEEWSMLDVEEVQS